MTTKKWTEREMETFKTKESILKDDQDDHQRANDTIQIS